MGRDKIQDEHLPQATGPTGEGQMTSSISISAEKSVKPHRRVKMERNKEKEKADGSHTAKWSLMQPGGVKEEEEEEKKKKEEKPSSPP